MAVRSSNYDGMRLSREAEWAGRAFACEDAEAEPADEAPSRWLWWIAAALALGGLAAIRII